MVNRDRSTSPLGWKEDHFQFPPPVIKRKPSASSYVLRGLLFNNLLTNRRTQEVLATPAQYVGPSDPKELVVAKNILVIFRQLLFYRPIWVDDGNVFWDWVAEDLMWPTKPSGDEIRKIAICHTKAREAFVEDAARALITPLAPSDLTPTLTSCLKAIDEFNERYTRERMGRIQPESALRNKRRGEWLDIVKHRPIWLIHSDFNTNSSDGTNEKQKPNSSHPATVTGGISFKFKGSSSLYTRNAKSTTTIPDPAPVDAPVKKSRNRERAEKRAIGIARKLAGYPVIETYEHEDEATTTALSTKRKRAASPGPLSAASTTKSVRFSNVEDASHSRRASMDDTFGHDVSYSRLAASPEPLNAANTTKSVRFFDVEHVSYPPRALSSSPLPATVPTGPAAMMKKGKRMALDPRRMPPPVRIPSSPPPRRASNPRMPPPVRISASPPARSDSYSSSDLSSPSPPRSSYSRTGRVRSPTPASFTRPAKRSSTMRSSSPYKSSRSHRKVDEDRDRSGTTNGNANEKKAQPPPVETRQLLTDGVEAMKMYSKLLREKLAEVMDLNHTETPDLVVSDLVDMVAVMRQFEGSERKIGEVLEEKYN